MFVWLPKLQKVHYSEQGVKKIRYFKIATNLANYMEIQIILIKFLADLFYEYINTQYKVVNNSAAAEDGPVTKKEREYYREIADNIFREAMRNSEPSVPGWKIWSAYTAVRLFGRWAINSSAPRKK